MARVKLLRQTLEDYNKKLTALDTSYQQQYEVYTGQADAYNAKIEAFNAGMAGLAPGDAFQDESGKLKTITPKGNIEDYAPPSGSMFSLQASPYKAVDGSVYYMDGSWYYMGELADAATHAPNGDGLFPETNTPAPIKIELKGVHPGAAPTSPTQPNSPMAPNLTQSDIRELQSPSLDQAGMQMAANKGIIGKSELAGMEPNKISAFTDPEDQNNLKEAGILARTLGGQL